MSKYIDVEKLIAEIERRIIEHRKSLKKDITLISEAMLKGSLGAYESIERFTTSFQQEQPKVQNGKFVFPKYLYARTKDNKTIDMSYAPQDMTAVEYIRNDFVEQEQSEVDLEKLGEIARHIIAVKQHVEDMRLSEDEWSLLEKIGYPDRH